MIKIDLKKDELQRVTPDLKPDLFSKLKATGSANLRKKSSQLGLIVLLGGLALGGVPPLVYYQFTSMKEAQHVTHVAELNDTKTRLDKEIAKMKPYQDELKAYEQQKKVVQDRLETVRKLLASRGTPVNVLDTVGQALSRLTWVDSLYLSMEEGKAVLEVGASAYTSDEVSEYVKRLSESVYLSDVKLEDLTTQSVRNIDIYTFKVKGRPNTSVRLPASQSP